MRRALGLPAALLAVLAAVLGAVLLAGCSSGSDALFSSPAATAPSSPAPMDLSVLVFNVEYGGTRASDQVIADVDADVVAVLESYNRLPTIARHAGYPYFDVGLQIMSKYPILEPPDADGLHAAVEVRPGEAVALVNTHLDYVQDGPNRLARGVPVADVLATEREVRLSSMEKLLPSATALLDAGWPVLLTGDFNEPSHLDDDIAWPVSEAVTAAGFTDAFRATHPDPAADPGFTWGGVAGSHGSPRRIDYAYVGGPVDVLDTEVVGEQGVEGVDRGYPGWTSDHRAVLARLRVSPAPFPATVAAVGRMRTLASDALHLRARDVPVDLATDAPSYAVGDPVTVRWSDGPANRWDWIGVYRAGASDPAKDDYLVWGYTGGHDAGALPPTADGRLVLGREHQGRPWPLPPGRYVVHYLLTDQYVSAGSTRFTVRR